MKLIHLSVSYTYNASVAASRLLVYPFVLNNVMIINAYTTTVSVANAQK